MINVFVVILTVVGGGYRDKMDVRRWQQYTVYGWGPRPFCLLGPTRVF